MLRVEYDRPSEMIVRGMLGRLHCSTRRCEIYSRRFNRAPPQCSKLLSTAPICDLSPLGA